MKRAVIWNRPPRRFVFNEGARPAENHIAVERPDGPLLSLAAAQKMPWNADTRFGVVGQAFSLRGAFSPAPDGTG
jgi:hypothetical protein